MKRRKAKKEGAPSKPQLRTARDILDQGRASTVFENPGWRPDLDGVGGVPRHDAVLYNRKLNALKALLDQKAIDKPQHKAAERYAELHEQSVGSGVQALDYTRDHVDGARGDPIGPGRIDAMSEIKACDLLLGPLRQVVFGVCCEAKSMADVAAALPWKEGVPLRRQKDTAADMLRFGLDKLAERWGFSEAATGRVKAHSRKNAA